MSVSNRSNRLTVIAAEIVTAHKEAVEAEARAMQRAIDAGKLLIEAKESLQHGQWLPWLKQHIAFSERTARNYMRLAEEANRHRLPISEMGVKEALRELATIDSIPLPRPEQNTLGGVERGGHAEDPDADTVFIWQSLWQPTPRDGDPYSQSVYYHTLLFIGTMMTIWRKPCPDIWVHERLRSAGFALDLAKWAVFEGRADEFWESMLRMPGQGEKRVWSVVP
jgi:hypothetical protein